MKHHFKEMMRLLGCLVFLLERDKKKLTGPDKSLFSSAGK